jgi:peptidoglycan-N-acetylglucosamine deacetylase
MVSNGGRKSHPETHSLTQSMLLFISGGDACTQAKLPVSCKAAAFSGAGWPCMRKFSTVMEMLPVYLATSGVCVAGGIFAWAAMAPSAQLFGATLRHTGDPSTMALTFDDGPNPAITPGLLELLERYNARATFFLTGKHTRSFPGLAKEISERGHTVGNHTETHPKLTFLSPRRIGEELDRCDEAITSATGKAIRWMRPPYGFRGPLLDGVVRARGGAGVVMWSAMAYDWKPQPAERVINRLRGARGGDIVLLHDADHRQPQSDRAHTVAALEYWLPRWKDAGLRFVNVDEMAGSGLTA